MSDERYEIQQTNQMYIKPTRQRGKILRENTKRGRGILRKQALSWENRRKGKNLI